MNGDDRTRQSVLSVDDDRELRDLLHELIIDMGHISETAIDGMDALEKMDDKQFDIVITDINMPRLNGVELIKRIATDFRDTDVIAMTGYQTEYNYTDIIALGASDFISKPININEFEAKIKRIVRERNMRSELRRLSTCDALTGIYNRRHLDENLRNEAIRACRQRYDLYLLLIDVDDFKIYNDKYSFEQGDDVLKVFGVIVKSAYTELGDKDDVVAYMGQDDFVMITTQERADLIVLRIIENFENLMQQFYDEDVLKRGYIWAKNENGEELKYPLLTVSLGVLLVNPGTFRHYSQVLDRAKTLLKEAKKKGLKAVGGLGMLVGQGARAFEIWTGKKAPSVVMRKAIEKRI